MKLIRKIVGKTVCYWALLGGMFVFAIMLVTSINTAAFAIHKLSGIAIPTLSGYEDFISLAISAAALMFFPYCQLQKGHIIVDLFSKQLPPFFCHYLDKFWLLVLVLLALFLSYWMLFGMIETYQDQVLSPVLSWSIWPSYLPPLLSLILWAIVCLSQIFQKKSV